MEKIGTVMKHKWKITPRGKITKYYTCKRCGIKITSHSIKLADELSSECKGNIKAVEVKNVDKTENSNGKVKRTF